MPFDKKILIRFSVHSGTNHLRKLCLLLKAQAKDSAIPNFNSQFLTLKGI